MTERCTPCRRLSRAASLDARLATGATRNLNDWTLWIACTRAFDF